MLLRVRHGLVLNMNHVSAIEVLDCTGLIRNPHYAVEVFGEHRATIYTDSSEAACCKLVDAIETAVIHNLSIFDMRMWPED